MLAAALLLAGAAQVDISPPKLPVIANCQFLEQHSSTVHAPLHARAIVMGDGSKRVAIAVVDSCMMTRELIDKTKLIVTQQSQIPEDRILISATHTHTAPAVMACLGSRVQTDYAEWLPGKIAEAIALAANRMQPARAGWAVAQAPDHTHTRRWILRADAMRTDPFGDRTVRANMHPGHENPNAIAPSGPSDPALSVLSLQTRDGRPLAVLANYSMHYFGAQAVSPDYFGVFAEYMAKDIGGGGDFVAIMSQGTSGDQQWMDYSKPRPKRTIQEYSRELVDIAMGAYRGIQYQAGAPLEMAEARLRLRRRTPNDARLAWARGVMAQLEDRLPKTQPEIYAREAIYLHEEPERELKLQAIRVGSLGISAIPNEVYALTGLKIKARSPLPVNFVIELANGAEGYIPPPEQHKMGGYTTWPARTAGLEEAAEPLILETVLRLLERVSGKPRQKVRNEPSAYARALQPLGPAHLWRLEEMDGNVAYDDRNSSHGRYSGGFGFYLDGIAPRSRAVHFGGGKLEAPVRHGNGAYTVQFWFWSGAGGTLFRYGGDAAEVKGDRLGSAVVPPKQWHHLAAVRQGDRFTVYVNGKQALQSQSPLAAGDRLVIGEDFEGKVDEVAWFSKALPEAAIQKVQAIR